jgi:hypothetical protein
MGFFRNSKNSKNFESPVIEPPVIESPVIEPVKIKKVQNNKNVCTEIIPNLCCPCNNKVYKTIGFFNRHKESTVHKTWELPQKVKELEILATRLTVDNEHLKRLNVILTNKIFDLENKINN